mmetsp:Transcript_3345/g.6653  ORF Transcript_3345/g.6653 Transcript_3345/m.6653 type:complete len:118 (+) Transcript_3345:92-445(+)
MAQDPAFRAYRAELQDKEWRLGRTPEFSHQLETRVEGVALLDVQMQVINGKINEPVIYSDALYPDVIDRAMVALTGVTYGRASIRAALEGLRPHFEDEGPRKLVDVLIDWLPANVDE